MTARPLLRNGLLCVTAIVVGMGLLEVSLRTYQSLKWNTSFWERFGGADQTDEWLGWKPRAFHSRNIDTVDQSGTPYNIQYDTYQYGFREYQEDNQELLRVFFIGDSYTGARQVSNDKAYYSVVKQSYPMNVFAFGGSGYGTLQEYMVFDKFFEEIAPDLLVLQFTPNDFFDNDYHLNQRFGGVIMGIRPYLIGDKIEYKNALSPINQILFQSAQIMSSRLLQLLHTRILIISRPSGLYQEINDDGFPHRGFAQSYNTTLKIMKMFVQRAGKTDVIAFCVRDQPELFYEAFLTIMKDVGVHTIAEVPRSLRAAESVGVEIRAEDGGHWNENGHRIVGMAIAKELKRLLWPGEASGRGDHVTTGGPVPRVPAPEPSLRQKRAQEAPWELGTLSAEP